MRWTRDLPGEGKMKQLGIEWTVCNDGIPRHEINMEMSLNAQARIGKKVNEDWVLQMALSAQEGNEFPMPIMQRIRKACYMIHSGVHRVSMADVLNETKIPCYLVNVTDTRMLDILPRVINTVNGHPEEREAVLVHARYLAERHGFTAEQVAKWTGLSAPMVSTHLRAGEVERKLAEHGIKADLPKSTLIHLSPLKANAPVLKAVVKLLKDEDLAGDRAKAVIDDAKRPDTEKAQLAEVERWRKVLEGAKPKPSANGKALMKRRNRGRFIYLLTDLERFLDNISQASQLQLDDQDSLVAVKSWVKIQAKMDNLIGEGVGK